MNDISIKIRNEDKFLRAFNRLQFDMADGIQKALLAAGVFTAGEVKKVITTGESMWKSPIDTGAMRRGIQMRQTGKLKVIVSPSRLTPYALFVHEGTRFMQPRPFFEITARSRQDKIEKFFNDRIAGVIRQTVRKAS